MSHTKFFLLASSMLVLASCTANKKVASNATFETPVSKDFAHSLKDRVFYAFDSSELSAESKATLDHQAEWMKSRGHARYKIEGHADERGTREYNIALGERRAHAAKKYLISKGVDEGQLHVISFGKEKPSVYGHDEQAWAQNRRAVVITEEGSK